jgi:hypothetical protein
MEDSAVTEALWLRVLRHAQEWTAQAGNEDVALVAGIAVGILYCFLGYRFLKLMIALTGFALAAIAAGLLMAWLTHINTIAVAVAGFIGGMAGAMFTVFVFRAGIFCLGMLGAALIAHHALAAIEVAWAPWAIVILGVLGGLLALLIERPVITVATAALGAWILLVTGALLLMKSDIAESVAVQEMTAKASWTILATWTVFTIAGTAAQFATYRKPRPQRP